MIRRTKGVSIGNIPTTCILNYTVLNNNIGNYQYVHVNRKKNS